MSLTFHATQEAQHTVTHRKRTIHNTKPKTTKNIQYIGCQTSKHFDQHQTTQNQIHKQPHLLYRQEESLQQHQAKEEGEKNNKGRTKND